MKKLIAHILILMMLTPALACAMPSCAAMDMPVQAMSDEHCAQHHEGKASTSPVMLQADCVSMDLQQAKTIFQFEKPNFELSYVIIDDASILSLSQTPSRLAIAADPPNLSSGTAQRYLVTQRFRI